MRTQREREDQTVVIATGLAIFAGVVVLGLLLGVLLDAVGDLSDAGAASLGKGTIAVAVLAGVSYLARQLRA